MNWRVVARPEVDTDVGEGATWYEDQQPGLGAEFIEEAGSGGAEPSRAQLNTSA